MIVSGQQTTQQGLQQKAQKKSKGREGLNKIFRTRLELDVGKIMEMYEKDDKGVDGDAPFVYNRDGLEEEVLEITGDLTVIKLSPMSVSFSCTLPKRFWKEFERDAIFTQQLYDRINVVTEASVKLCAKAATLHDEKAVKARENGDEKAVKLVVQEFYAGYDKLLEQTETMAMSELSTFFTEKVKAYGRYRRYQVKAGAKFVTTLGGLAISLAGLATAATPAAPATLIPALIGLVNTAASIAHQIRELAQEAEAVAEKVYSGIKQLEKVYFDDKGSPREALSKGLEFVKGMSDTLLGGWAKEVAPSVKSLLGDVDRHRKKIDGLDVRLHRTGIHVTDTTETLAVLDDSLEKIITLLEKRPTAKTKKEQEKVLKALKQLNEAGKLLGEVRMKFEAYFDTVPPQILRIEVGRAKNEELKKMVEDIGDAVGAGNWAMVGELFGQLALLGVTFSSFAGGLPGTDPKFAHDLHGALVERAMTYSGIAYQLEDVVKDFTVDWLGELLTED